jgi:hypothetical protein
MPAGLPENHPKIRLLGLDSQQEYPPRKRHPAPQASLALFFEILENALPSYPEESAAGLLFGSHKQGSRQGYSPYAWDRIGRQHADQGYIEIRIERI